MISNFIFTGNQHPSMLVLNLFFLLCCGDDRTNMKKMHELIDNTPSRFLKSYDRRNQEDNTNFYNFDKNEKYDNKPSFYDKQKRIAMMINSALSSNSEKNFRKFKLLDQKMQAVRDEIEENDNSIYKNPDERVHLDLISWLFNENDEEKMLDKDLENEVRNDLNFEKEKQEKVEGMRDKRFIECRKNDHMRMDKMLQHLRQKYNVE